MLKPREPPSRRRTAVTLLASPSYGQTEERYAGQRLGLEGLGESSNSSYPPLWQTGAPTRMLQPEQAKQ